MKNPDLLRLKEIALKANEESWGCYSVKVHESDSAKIQVRMFAEYKKTKIIEVLGEVFWSNQQAEDDGNYLSAVKPSTIISLIDELIESRKVIGFYAYKNHWIGYHREVDTIRDDHEPSKADDGFDIQLGGKRAREHEKKFGGME